LFALAGEHHAGDHFDPAGAGAVKHCRPYGLASWRLGTGRGKGSEEGRMGQGNLDILRICGVVPHIVAVLCGFSRATPQKRAEFQGFHCPRPSQGDAVNKAELTAALAMRTKMSKADAGRAIEALFDDKGIIAAELKKGAKVQITGFGNFEARKRAARMGRNPKTGGVIQIKASIAPAFRAGKQLKMVVNNRKEPGA